MKNLVCAAVGMLGSVALHLFGGWDTALATLVIFMVLDYTTGLTVAFLGNSEKSENGSLSSYVGFRGIATKIFLLALVAVGYRLDLLLGLDYIRGAVIFAFAANEAISITENAGLMGVPIPKPILKAIDILKNKENND